MRKSKASAVFSEQGYPRSRRQVVFSLSVKKYQIACVMCSFIHRKDSWEVAKSARAFPCFSENARTFSRKSRETNKRQ